jgi:hypothetical protein
MNVLKYFKKAALLTLLQNGVSQHEIARKTRVDRKTIRKYQHEFESKAVGISNSPMATAFRRQRQAKSHLLMPPRPVRLMLANRAYRLAPPIMIGLPTK